MPESKIPVTVDDVASVAHRLNQEFGKLEGAGHRVTKILYPSWIRPERHHPREFTDEERGAVARALRQLIDADRFPMSPRLSSLKSALAKLDPKPARAVEPLPPPKAWVMGQRKGRGRR